MPDSQMTTAATSAITSAAAAVTRQAAERVMERVVERPRLQADGATARDEPSPELAPLLSHLRSTLASYVGEQREAGVPVERVLVEVKGLVRQAASLERWFDPTDTLMGQAV